MFEPIYCLADLLLISIISFITGQFALAFYLRCNYPEEDDHDN